MALSISFLILGFVFAAEIVGICRKSYSFEKDSAGERIKHLLFPAAMLLLYIFRKITERFPARSSRDRMLYYENRSGKGEAGLYEERGDKKETKVYECAERKENTAYYEKIYTGEDIGRIKDQCEAGIVSAMLGVLFAASALTLLLHVSGYDKTEYLDSIKRPEQGIEEVEMTAIYDEDSFDLELQVSEVYPKQQQQLQRISETEEHLADYILGRNESLACVKTDLNLRETYTDKSVTVDWSSSDSELVRNDGTVKNQELISDKRVALTATLTCYEEARTVNFTVIVKPASEESAKKAFLIKNLEELMENTQTEEIIPLPDTAAGQDLKFIKKKKESGGKILLLGVVTALLMLPLWYENKRNRLHDRETELMCDYPEVLSKFAILLEAGLVPRAAFERIAGDYEKRSATQKNSGNAQKKRKIKEGSSGENRRKRAIVCMKGKRYVYEEMLRTRNEIRLGKAEAEAYEAFGRRCGNIFYIRFGALLAQNVKKGSRSLVPQLHKEVSESFSERQQAVRKRGEEASMKLLLPMMGMFALVLAIILVPAFLSV